MVNDASVKRLHSAYRTLMDEVARQARDKRNLGPTKSERYEEELQERGAVSIAAKPDPLIEAARAIREGLAEVEAAVDHANLLRSKAIVEPAEFDQMWVGHLRDIEESVGPSVQNPSSQNLRPEMPPDVEKRLNEWGLLGRKRSE